MFFVNYNCICVESQSASLFQRQSCCSGYRFEYTHHRCTECTFVCMISSQSILGSNTSLTIGRTSQWDAHFFAIHSMFNLHHVAGSKNIGIRGLELLVHQQSTSFTYFKSGIFSQLQSRSYPN